MLPKNDHTEPQYIADYIDKHTIECVVYTEAWVDGSTTELSAEPKSQWYHSKIASIRPKVSYLYIQWNRELLHKPIIAIVWPRRMSDYAKRILDKLFLTLAKYDIVTISWGADGVDTIVHTLSMKYNIPTIMVLWGGLWYYHTSTKWNLLENIVTAWWLVISEYKLFASPMPYMFPHRNRLVAWLSNIVFLPEAALKSGSLITANFAYKMNIPVYAPMQNIFFSSSYGSNEAIIKGIIKPVARLEEFIERHFEQYKKDYYRDEKNDLWEIYENSDAWKSLSIWEYLAKDMERKLFDL